MRFSFRRLGAVLRKEVREYRRSPFIVGTMAVLPLVFLVEPLIIIFRIGPTVAASAVDKAVGSTFLLLLIAPALLPAVIAAYSVVGEREQGTLEPLLTTPLRREELLLGKALGVVVPAVGIAYVLFVVIQVCARALCQQCGCRVSPGARSAHPGRDSLCTTPRGMVDLRGHRHLDASERRSCCSAVGNVVKHSTACRCGSSVVQRVHPELHPRSGVRTDPPRGRRHPVSDRRGPVRSGAADHRRVGAARAARRRSGPAHRCRSTDTTPE